MQTRKKEIKAKQRRRRKYKLNKRREMRKL